MRSIPLSICSMLVAKLRRTWVSKPLSLPGTTATWALLQQRGGEADRVGDLDAAGLFAEVGADVGEAVERALRAARR